jgi:hypothetical protein
MNADQQPARAADQPVHLRPHRRVRRRAGAAGEQVEDVGAQLPRVPSPRARAERRSAPPSGEPHPAVLGQHVAGAEHGGGQPALRRSRRQPDRHRSGTPGTAPPCCGCPPGRRPPCAPPRARPARRQQRPVYAPCTPRRTGRIPARPLANRAPGGHVEPM